MNNVYDISRSLINVNKHTPWMAVILSIVLTIFATFLINDVISRIAQERFEAQAKETRATIEIRIRTYEQVLSGAKGLFTSSNDVTREEWKIFVENQSSEKRFPGILGIGFSKLIGGKDNLTAHIDQIRKEGFQNYTVGIRRRSRRISRHNLLRAI